MKILWLIDGLIIGSTILVEVLIDGYWFLIPPAVGLVYFLGLLWILKRA